MRMTFEDSEYVADFGLVYSKANELLVTSSAIDGFPFKVKKFIKEQSDICLCTYKKAKAKFGIDVSCFGSESAVIQELNGAYIIFYNQEEPTYRVRFSIMHEFAHYYLGHEMNLNQQMLMYQKQEVEANCFAAQILMPEQIIRTATRRGYATDVGYIMNAFDVSLDAAQRRKKTLARYDYEWHNCSEKEYDDLIVMKYAKVINTIAPINQNRFFDFDDEYEREMHRKEWMDTRSRWS